MNADSRAGDYVVLSPMDLVSGPCKMDETTTHTSATHSLSGHKDLAISLLSACAVHLYL